MWAIGKKLLEIYNRPSDSGGDTSVPTYGRSTGHAESLAKMSDEDNKWQLTNLAGIGSEDDQRLREEAAQHEAEFDGAGQQPGLEIWRIEKFSPQRQSIRADNLSLYSGDSYIILKTTQKEDSDAFDWQLHYWIGKDSTQDEYGAAAYFAVNIDDLLGGKPVQHRELQYSESAMFHSYFGSVTYLDGGSESGFSKVEPDVYKPRLLQMTSIGGTVRVLQVPLSSSSLNNGDVFILDNGMTVYQFNSSDSSVKERVRASQIVNEDILADRDFEPELLLLDGDEVFSNEPFWDLLGDKLDELPSVDPTRDEDASDDVDFSSPKSLLCISNETGELILTVIKRDDSLSAEDVNDKDVWAVSCDQHCFIYVGSATNKDEKFFVWNSCDAILSALSLDRGTSIVFFSRDSDAGVWNQLFQ